MTLDILICSLNKGIVRIDDLLRPQQDGVRYVVSYQYTDERYLELVPEALKQRKDVVLSVYKGQGLSNNRNHALELAKADLVVFADDDSRLSDEAPAIIKKIFSEDPDLDVAFFRASTYTGKLLKQYPEAARQFTEVPTDYDVSTIEMVFRRTKVQNRLLFDERFGLQRSKGALCYYQYGSSAWLRCFAFAFNSARRRLCHFFPMLRHLYQGIRYVKRH